MVWVKFTTLGLVLAARGCRLTATVHMGDNNMLLFSFYGRFLDEDRLLFYV